MPNHVQNEVRIRCAPETLEELLNAIQADPVEGDPHTGYGSVDFNKLIPMPEELNLEVSSKTFLAMEVYLTSLNPRAPWFGEPETKRTESAFDELVRKANGNRVFARHKGDLTQEALKDPGLGFPLDELMTIGKKAIRNLETYGASDWYEWRIKPDHWNTKWNAYECEYQGDGVLRFETAWSAPHPVIKELSRRCPEAEITHSWADEDIGFNCGQTHYYGGELIDEYIPERSTSNRFAEQLWEGQADIYVDEGLRMNG